MVDRWTIRTGAVAGASIAGAIAIGCGTNLFLPDKKVDAELGAEYSKSVEAEMGLVELPRTQGVIEAIGEKLVGRLEPASFDYHFAIVDEAGSNAFAIPGGYIYISRGLLSLARTEDELAGVISHEIEHVERRHSVKQMQRQRRLGVLALPGKLVAGIISKDLANLVGAPFELVAASYSRDQETEADTLGQALTARSGYSPMALSSILDRMERFESSETGAARAKSFFDSHPSTPDRVARLEKDGRKLVVVGSETITSSPQAFLDELDGLLLGPDPNAGVVRGHEFLHPELDLYIALPPDWQVINTRQFVAAVAPKKDGVATLGVVGKGTAEDLPKLAEAKAAEIEKEFKIKPTEIAATTAGGVPAHALVLTDTSGAAPTNVYFLWFVLGSEIYQVIGMSPESHRPLIKATIESVRPLTKEEHDSILATRLRIATANEGESINDFSKRTGNTWTAAQTSIANQLDAAAPLAKGARIKIAVQEPLGKSP